MTHLAYTLADSRTMLRRQLKHLLRYPSMTVLLLGMPVIFLLLFVYVFGGQLGAGLVHVPGVGHGGRDAYLNFVVPGILLLTLGAAANGTSILVAMDMTGGIVARFRTMSIARGSVLAGHVLGSVIQALLGIVVVTGIALALGFRPTGGPLAWLGALAILALFANAMAWVATALGLVAGSVETASNTPMFLTLLPFLSSGFVTIASMPPGLRQFARYQPFTPVTDAVRGLLFGGTVGTNVVWAAVWSVGITVACYLWAIRLYNRQPAK
ncbi:MAG TPA: ABC transporter permease [Solirubrobacteraceae bacterium]|nr:ABC transporter permease [Solirubrobacteraceae bacterium]